MCEREAWLSRVFWATTKLMALASMEMLKQDMTLTLQARGYSGSDLLVEMKPPMESGRGGYDESI